MLSNHLISIIIPTYNYGHRIRKALESIRDQNDDQIEILVVDDGSTDQTAAVIQAFQTENPAFNLHYYYQENKGAGAARNAGIHKAKGEYLLLLDADDHLLPNSLALFRQAIAKYPQAGMISAGHISFNERNQVIKSHPFKNALTDSHETNFLYYLRKKVALVPGANIYQKKVFDQIHYPESVKNAEDVSVFFQVLATQTCVSFPDPVVRHNKHDGSLRHQFAFHKEAGLVIADLIFDKNILDTKYFKYRREYLSSRYLSLARMAYRHKAFDAVVGYYENAIKTFPKHVLKIAYFKKYFHARLRG